MRRDKYAIQNWNPSDLPAWLNEDCYVRRILPQLGKLKVCEIAQTLLVSQPYDAFICAGRRRPHPRHWEALADLGVSSMSEGITAADTFSTSLTRTCPPHSFSNPQLGIFSQTSIQDSVAPTHGQFVVSSC